MDLSTRRQISPYLSPTYMCHYDDPLIKLSESSFFSGTRHTISKLTQTCLVTGCTGSACYARSILLTGRDFNLKKLDHKMQSQVSNPVTKQPGSTTALWMEPGKYSWSSRDWRSITHGHGNEPQNDLLGPLNASQIRIRQVYKFKEFASKEL